jgi:alkanesulfonate monooxygenase SsuD/methylene tetrahydromethanopterin reductase-like flavin-dependent oxidoreductase (luciferase family)
MVDIVLSIALDRTAQRIAFLIACRPGPVAPAQFMARMGTAARLLGGRVAINIVRGQTPTELRS